MSYVNRRVRDTSFNFPTSVSKNAEVQLSRLTLAHMLWENQFYIDGKSNADLIKDLITKVTPTFVAGLANKARSVYKLRHMPLFMMRELARTGAMKAEDLTNVIQRPDEMSEFVSIYWKDKKQPLSNQVKKGLADAFAKFSEYALAKHDKNSASVKLRDVMFLCHPKPGSPEQEALFKRVAENELKTPDTWETELSGGADKAVTFSRLMHEKKLGALAFLRNLRNMVSAGISEKEIRAYAKSVNVDRVLPFRYIAAATIVPQFEDMLEEMMLRSLSTAEKLPGKTVLLVDVSGSMFGPKVSEKSDIDRFDAAAALAMLCREICEDVSIYTFSDNLVQVAPRRGFALREAIKTSQHHNGTDLRGALKGLSESHDRIIVFTDEQTQTRANTPKADNAYVVNVGSNQKGITTEGWVNITGFSEAIIDYIREYEKQD